MKPDNITPLLSSRQAADRLGVTTDTIRRWANLGLLPVAARVGVDQRFRFRVEDVDDMIKKEVTDGDN